MTKPGFALYLTNIPLVSSRRPVPRRQKVAGRGVGVARGVAKAASVGEAGAGVGLGDGASGLGETVPEVGEAPGRIGEGLITTVGATSGVACWPHAASSRLKAMRQKTNRPSPALIRFSTMDSAEQAATTLVILAWLDRRNKHGYNDKREVRGKGSKCAPAELCTHQKDPT
jgi:hypothetical protein